MKKPVLVILAAGMGSRYGGLKQMDSMDDMGHKIIDFSMYDARRAGFEKVVFIIKHEIEETFKEIIGRRVSEYMEVDYVFQELSKVPEGFKIPEGRVKPWGTAHAIYCCRDVVDVPFMVINADDFYGPDGYKKMYEFLIDTWDRNDKYSMVAYELGKTLTDKGSVTRGVCKTSNDGLLTDIIEEKMIIRTENGAAFSRDGGQNFMEIDAASPVSMNMWGLKPGIFKEFDRALDIFFKEKVQEDPLKVECLLPSEIDVLIKADKVSVSVLKSSDSWFGVTYPEDKPNVVKSIEELRTKGQYPEKLW